MIRLTLLGTSGSTPTKNRGMPGAAIARDGKVYLFDCGEGTQMKMMAHRVNISRVEAIFISHIHGDHVIGIAGLIRTMGLNNRSRPLTIYVPKGQESAIRSLIVFDKAMIQYPIAVVGINAGKFYLGTGFTIAAFRLNHQITTFGYVFAEDNKRRFIKEKCKALGIKGTMFADLERKGEIKIGKRTIKIGSVTTLQKGKKIVYATDTRPSATTVEAAKDADVLIHEAAYTQKEKKLAVERKHSTAEEAANVAKAARVKMLVLTHLSARQRAPDELAAEARKVFKNTVVGKDGYAIDL